MNPVNRIMLVIIIFFALAASLSANDGGPCLTTIDPPKQKTVGFRMVQLKGVKWRNGQTIRILFMGGTSSEKQLVRETASEWTKHANLKFEFYNSRSQLGNRNSDIRISFDKNKGSHSAVGTHTRYYSQNESTMNFGWNSKGTILHEFGHALGLKHEHQNPSAGIPWNKPVVYKHFEKYGWSKKKVDRVVINPLDRGSVNYSNYDDKSIMVYNFSSDWTLNGMSAQRGTTLSEMDITGIKKMYPGKDNTADENEINPVDVTPTTDTTTTDTTNDTNDNTTKIIPAVVVPTNKTEFREGAIVKCGSVSGKIIRQLGKKILVDFKNGMRVVVHTSGCQVTSKATTVQHTIDKPVKPDSGQFKQGARVSCEGNDGKITRTLGKKLLIDFDNGKRDIYHQRRCSLL